MFDNLVQTVKENKVLVVILIIYLMYKCGKELFSNTSKESMSNIDQDYLEDFSETDGDDTTGDDTGGDDTDGDDTTGDDADSDTEDKGTSDDYKKGRDDLCKEKEIDQDDCTDKKICKEYEIPMIACTKKTVKNLIEKDRYTKLKSSYCKKKLIDNCTDKEICGKLNITKCKEDEIKKSINAYNEEEENIAKYLDSLNDDKLCAHVKSVALKKIKKSDKKIIKDKLCEFDLKVKEYSKQQDNENIDKKALLSNSEKLNNSILTTVIGDDFNKGFLDLCSKNEIRKMFIKTRLQTDLKRSEKIKNEINLAKDILYKAKTFYTINCEKN